MATIPPLKMVIWGDGKHGSVLPTLLETVTEKSSSLVTCPGFEALCARGMRGLSYHRPGYRRPVLNDHPVIRRAGTGYPYISTLGICGRLLFWL